MANGFFLGGVAEGMADADKRALERDRYASDVGLRTRALDLTEQNQRSSQGIAERAQTLAEKNAARSASQEDIARADKLIADTMATVGETVKSAVAAGRDADSIRKAVAPLVESAARIAQRVGRDPAALTSSVDAMMTGPSAVEAGAVKGAAEGTSEVAKAKVVAPTLVQNKTLEGQAAGAGEAAKQKALAAAGIQDEAAGFKSKDEKIKAENSLRDDYVKQSQQFVTIRDAKNRLDNLDRTGAGDMSLVFTFMKMLDPGSTVREGEYATAANSGGVPSAVQALYNKALGEGNIGTKARNEIIQQSNKFFTAAALQQDKNTTTFANIATRLKLDPNNVVIDLMPAATKAAATGKAGKLPPPPDGFNLVQ